MSSQPQEAPPSYDQAKRQGGAAPTTATTSGGMLSAGNVVDERRSMEEMLRPLPAGWVRQLDPESQHNFYVDTRATPPRSTWLHPYDDPQYQREHPEEVRKERERLERARIVHDDTDDEDDAAAAGPASKNGKSSGSGKHSSTAGAGAGFATGAAASSLSSSSQPKGVKKLGRSLKDKMTGTTHEQRVAQRRQREEAERRAWEQHQAIRAAMMRAAQTGQPQLLGRDQQGREIWAQPPPPGAFGRGASLGYSPYQTMGGPYGAYGPYSRPYGPYARGGGMGGMPLLGGLAGGMLLGGLLF